MDGHGTVPSVPSVPRRINDLSSESDKDEISMSKYNRADSSGYKD